MTQSDYLNMHLAKMGYTQKDVSERSGIAQGTLGKLFTPNSLSTASVDQLVRLSAALDFSLDDYAEKVCGAACKSSDAQFRRNDRESQSCFADSANACTDKVRYAVKTAVTDIGKDATVHYFMRRERVHMALHIISAVAVIVTTIAAFCYFRYDALRGDWGIIQYTARPTEIEAEAEWEQEP